MEEIHPVHFYNYLKVLLFTPEEPWRIGAVALGDRGYICYRCSAMFKFKDQFICHINRKIMVIEYTCTRCSPEQTYVFYNGCTWFMHVRSHFQMIRYPKVELDKIKIKELPIGEVSVSDEPTIYIDEEIPIESENEFIDPFMYQPIMNEESTALVRLQRVGIWFKRRTLTIRQVCKNMPKCEIISVNVFRRLIAHISFENTDSSNVDIKEEFTEEPVVIQDPAAGSSKEDSFPKCLECNQYPENTMYNHFLEANLPRSKSFECSTCHLITPTLCSHLAHKRIHQKEPPHVCPECGKDFPNHDLLENHMSITCFHNSKAVRYNCPAPKCWKIFATTQNFTKHMSNHYMVNWFCKTCNTHFPTQSEIQLHFTRSGHNDIVKFHKCLLCPSENQLFTLKIQEHTEMHVNDLDNYIYVNVCPVCKKVFKSVERFSSHMYLSCGKYVVLDKHQNTISGGSYQENVGQTAKSVEPAISSKSTTAMENKDKLLMCTFCGGIMEYCYGQEHVKTCKIDLKPNLTFIDPTKDSICQKGHINTSQINKGKNSSDEPSQKKPKFNIGEGSNKSPSTKENKDNFLSEASQEGSYKGKMGEKTIRKRGQKDTGTISNPSENGIGDVSKESM